MKTFDQPRDWRKGTSDNASDEHTEVLRLIRDMHSKAKSGSMRSRIRALRQAVDEGPNQYFKLASSDVTVTPVNVKGINAEWVQTPSADLSARLLYLHGGGFSLGSRLSHRPITTHLSSMANIPVLAIDYRLIPESKRQDGIQDCQIAYQWLLENGPDGPAEPGRVFVAGDSAGGNLALMLISWIRDAGLRQADGAICLSPATDATTSNPSMRANIKSDPFLGPGLGSLVRLPHTLRYILIWLFFTSRLDPKNPVVSPLFGELANLPPTLIQASECEMMVDDCLRYVNKARAAGSPAVLQTWPGMVHAWQLYAPLLPEAMEALEAIADFISSCKDRS